MAEAYAFDIENGNKLWEEAINAEMPKIHDSVAEHDGDMNHLIGYQKITGHVIFDVKLAENFR